MSISFITDPLVTTAGAVRPALLLAREFVNNGYDITLVSSRIDERIENAMRNEGVNLRCVGPKFSVMPSLPTFDAWARNLILHENTREIHDSDFVVNTSSCIEVPADAYYAQGPMTRALDDMSLYMPAQYKYSYKLLSRALRLLEHRLIGRLRQKSNLFVANSKFCASMYCEWDAKVDMIIYPPLDCALFEPKTASPTADYVLTYLGVYGKEGNSFTIKAIADAGVTLKMFGDTKFVPRSLKKHPNISLLGKVSDQELARLYSNALFTLFAFNHEPFGYIPVESMACGTPVLTYNRQGPAETVIDSGTGWVEESDSQLVRFALSLWKKAYPMNMRKACRKRALMFDVIEIAKKWSEVLNAQNVNH